MPPLRISEVRYGKSPKAPFCSIERADKKIGEGSYIRRREILEQHVDRYAPDYFDSAWKAMKADLEKKKENTRRRLIRVAEEEAQACHIHVSLLIHKLLGDPNSPNKLTIQSRVQSVLGEWRSEWQCPSGYENHILKEDLSIPPELRTEDLAVIRQEGDDSSDCDTDSDGNDEEESDYD